nr:GntR family transcriptional regulator [Streptomyces sp. L2]
MEYGPHDQVERDVPRVPFQQLAGILRARVKRGDSRPDPTAPCPARTPSPTRTGCPATTVRRAIAALTEEGLVYAVSGRGTCVVGQPPGAPAPDA